MADTSYTHTNDFKSGVASSVNGVNASLPTPKSGKPAQDAGKTVLIGLLGGVASAVAFTVYQRLPEDQRDRLHGQVRSMIASRLNEFRDGLNL